MRTRQIDYSDENTKSKMFTKRLSELIIYHNHNKNKNTIINKIDNINSIILYCLRNIHMLMDFKNLDNVKSNEKFYKVIIYKKTEYEKDIAKLSVGVKDEDKVKFQKKTKKLIKNCIALKCIVEDYFIRKSIFVLFRTNQDIFRIVNSFL